MNEFIDTSFNFYSDSGGGDPDLTSPTLRKYHKHIWSKPLPNGVLFNLNDNKAGYYLYHKSELGEFSLGSDAIWHTYKNQKRKQWLTNQIQGEVDDFFSKGSSIGAYIIFPNKKLEGKFTINQARGVNSLIDDRFDLTLECIRLFYINETSPLYDTLLRYKFFFELFIDFKGYVNFFLLNDLLDANYNIKFYLPFDNFKTRPSISSTDEYLIYKSRVLDFVNSRNKRIISHLRFQEIEQNTCP